MRLGDPEREAVLERLKEHAAAGRLELSELERRVVIVARAGTWDEAASVLADLPPLASGTDARRVRRRRRGHGEVDVPDPEWQPTPERFRDPRSGALMRVWVDRAGGRHYVPEGDR